MARKEKNERSLSMQDLRGAMAEEHPERDAGINAFVAMTSDTIEEQQPDGTYRFALNAVNEDRNEAGRLQNEESNEECFKIEDIEVKGLVIARLCCSTEQHEYTAANISTIINSLDVRCSESEYVDTGYWTIDWDGKGGYQLYTTAQVIEYLSQNIGVHRIVAKCRSGKFEVIVTDCCNNITTIPATGFFEINAQFVHRMFEQCATPNLVNEDEDGYCVCINENSYYSSTDLERNPVLLTTTAFVKILCSDTCFDVSDIVPVNEYISPEAGTTIDIASEVVSDIMGVYSSSTETTSGYKYVAFYNANHPFTSDDNLNIGISIQLNGFTVQYNYQYDDSISSYWYIDSNGYIVVKFYVWKSDSYNFVFQTKRCEGMYSITINKCVRANIYDDKGNEIGYITPTSVIVKPSTHAVVLQGTSATGIVGRFVTISGVTKQIDYYEASNQAGIIDKLATDAFNIDMRCNPSITAHCTEYIPPVN